MITELKINDKPTGLYAIHVAPDASNYRFGIEEFGRIIYPKDLCYKCGNVWGYGNVILPEGSFKILNEVTEHEIGFDCEPYVYKNTYGYVNYVKTDKGLNVDYTCRTKEESFYSLLQANGLYFVNPMGDEPKEELFTNTFMSSDGFKGKINYAQFNERFKSWQSYEDKLVTKLLIIQKI